MVRHGRADLGASRAENPTKRRKKHRQKRKEGRKGEKRRRREKERKRGRTWMDVEEARTSREVRWAEGPTGGLGGGKRRQDSA